MSKRKEASASLTPVRGWNSYDCYGCAINEAQFRANAEAMAVKLLPHGYTYACMDALWYYDDVTPTQLGATSTREPHLDAFGRPVPSPLRFPSSADGKGFKPLADAVHRLGLKFGLHIMRGIPRLAVERRLPVARSRRKAPAIANQASRCSWENTMFGVDMGKAGAQAWYDSLLELYAGWGVDLIKADDFGNTPYHREEVAALHRAVKNCGRPVRLSLSPGIMAHEMMTAHPHVAEHSDLWRISADIWDKWNDVRYLFPLCAFWSGAIGPASFPDADMLPYGMMGLGNKPTLPTRKSRLTADEVRTHFTLLAIARSPLLFGGDIPQLDDFTLAILTNPEVLAINSRSRGNRPLWLWPRDDRYVAWTAEAEAGPEKYLAVFNLGDEPAEISVDLAEHGFGARVRLRDLWARADLGTAAKTFAPRLAPHACALVSCQTIEK